MQHFRDNSFFLFILSFFLFLSFFLSFFIYLNQTTEIHTKKEQTQNTKERKHIITLERFLSAKVFISGSPKVTRNGTVR